MENFALGLSMGFILAGKLGSSSSAHTRADLRFRAAAREHAHTAPSPHHRLPPLAVSPAVVVGAMFDLKQAGYGVAKNIPVIVVAAASFDDVVGTLQIDNVSLLVAR